MLKIFALSRQRIKLLLATIAILLALVILYLFDPAKPGIYPPCPILLLTGFYCPGCGSTRALHQLLHGHILAALKLNSLMVLSLPFILYAYADYAWQVILGKPARRINIPAWIIWLILIIIILYWILRNIPSYPFSLLAPR